MRRLWRASIWHPSAIPIDEAKYASPLKRVVFPAFNVIMIALGLAGLSTGFEALRLTFPTPFPTVLYSTLVVAGLVCFGACAFPRLWAWEVVGKFVILVGLAVLFAAMLVAAAEIEGHSGRAIAPMIVGLSLIPFLRLWILAAEWAGRKR